MTPFVVDANVMNYFQRERLLGEQGEAWNAIEAIKSVSSIALDADGHCEAEWLECAGGAVPLALKDWIADMLASEKIQLFNFNCDNMFKELGALGVPKKDHKWVRLARSAPSDFIVTEDIDLFDPTKKCATNEKKQELKHAGSGPVAKHLRKTHKIVVTCCSHVPTICNS